MTPGQQFITTIGFETLKANVTYHVVAEDMDNDRIILASFGKRQHDVCTTVVNRTRFRQVVERKLVRLCQSDEMRRFPPWLSDRENDCLQHSPRLYANGLSKEDDQDRGMSSAAVVDSRLEHVLAAIDASNSVFAQLDFNRALNRFARDRNLNQTRLRRWVVCYLAFGCNRWALLPPAAGRGRYNRALPTPSSKRRGRPHRLGHSYGHDVDHNVKELIKSGFVKHARLGKSLADVYADALTYTFGCLTVESSKKETSIYHPLGNPFPTYGQFRYWSVKLLGHETVWSKLFGKQKYRTRNKVPKGAYSEGILDLMEKVYTDAATSDAHPRSHLSKLPLPRLQIVEVIDGLSGMTCGIGIGVGTERTSLYKQALAITALPKSLFGEVLGITIDDEDWPVNHLPRSYISDRGAGSSEELRNLMSSDGYHGSPDMTPAYTPQSNAVVESSHNRAAPKSGAPTYPVSTKTPVEMAVDVVREAMAKNRSKSVASRLTPAQVGAGIVNPIQLWNDYAARNRQAGYVMNINDVITRFLPTVTYTIIRGHLTRHGIIYRSDELINTSYFRQIFKYEGAELTGYAFDISNRVEWVMVGRQLIKVHAISNVRTQSSERVLSRPELEQNDAALDGIRAKTPGLRRAEDVRIRNDSLEHSGKKYKNPTQRKGRAKVRTAALRSETAALNNE